jgi:hypothetical protein
MPQAEDKVTGAIKLRGLRVASIRRKRLFLKSTETPLLRLAISVDIHSL